MLIFRLFNLILIMLAYHGGANAQAGTEIQNNGYGYGYLANFDSSMAMVVVFLVVAFFLMGFISIYIRRCAESAAGNSAGAGAQANSGSARRKGLDQAVIDTFPILVYSAVKDLKIGKGALECAVCLSEFDDYETLRLLRKCDHVFHPSCIDAWLASHVTCPVCRANLAGDPKSDSNPENSGPVVVGEVRNDDVAVNVDEDRSGDPQAVEMANMTVRSEISRKLPKSHSTGHTLIRPGDNTERFTLRLPAEVRRQLVSTGNNKLRRSTSYDVVLPRVGSSRRGYRDDGGGGGEGKRSVDNQIGWFDPWALLRTPSSIARVGSVTVKSPKGGDADGAFGKTPSKSVRIPLDCLNVKADKSNESISQLPV